MIFTAEKSWSMVKSDFVVPVQILWWFWYQISRKYLHCLYKILSDILSHWLPAVEWRSVSATRLKISVGQMSPTDLSSTEFFSYLSPSSAHCKGSNFFEIFEGLWYQFSQCPSCYEHHNVFLLRYSYYTVILCVFSEFEFTDVVFVQGINTKSFKFS